MDKIKINNLEVYGCHGVFKEENILGQKFLISATLYADTKDAAKKDDLDKSIDYSSVCIDIKDIVKNNTYKLIETLGDKIAKELLIKYNKINKIKIEVKKPHAPIPLSLKYVSVELTRRWHEAYIGLGSNLGDKESNIRKSIELISGDKECNIYKVSDLITTKPIGYTEQDDFLNGCISVKTLKSPMELLELLQNIEKILGRTREIKWGPRTIDLDILLYEDKIIDSEELTIPHKEMHCREFVLYPLFQIAPNVIHPKLKENISDLRSKITKVDTMSFI